MHNTNNEHYIYQHVLNGVVFYIGLSKFYKKRNPFYRAYDISKTHRSNDWMNFVNGRKIEVEILIQGISKEDAIKKEIEIIAKHKRVCDGGTLVNLAIGGSGANGFKYTKEMSNKRSSDQIGRKKSAETKLKLSLLRSKIVLNSQTGIYYNSAKEAAHLLGMPSTTFRKRMNAMSFIYV